MSCFSDQEYLLLDYAAGRLSAESRRQVREHLAQCESCRKGLASLSAMAADLARLKADTQHDVSPAGAALIMAKAAVALRQRAAGNSARGESSSAAGAPAETGQSLRQMARSRARHTLLRRLLIPMAAAAVMVIGVYLTAYFSNRAADSQPPAAISQLYASAAAIGNVEDLRDLEPTARRALDQAVADGRRLDRIADLQLVHYITRRAVDAGQVTDVHFLLGVIQDQERREQRAADRTTFAPSPAGRDGRWSLLETPAMAADSVTTDVTALDQARAIDQARALLQSGKYEPAFKLLSAANTEEARPLTAYAALRAGHLGDAGQLLATLTAEPGRGAAAELAERRQLARLLQAELAIVSNQYEKAMNHFATAAESDSRLWFQAGYICKYELKDDALAGLFFERVGDSRLATHVERRFRADISLPLTPSPLLSEDFESYQAGSLPQSWRMIPTQAGEFMIDLVDGSKVLRQTETGARWAKLITGSPVARDYRLTCDLRVLKSDADAQVDVGVYDLGVSHYAVSFRGTTAQLVVTTRRTDDGEALEPAAARAQLPRSFMAGDWWRVAVQTQNLGPNQTRVSAKIWLRSQAEPQDWMISWTETTGGQVEPLQRGRVSFRVASAETVLDNVEMTPAETSSP